MNFKTTVLIASILTCLSAPAPGIAAEKAAPNAAKPIPAVPAHKTPSVPLEISIDEPLDFAWGLYGRSMYDMALEEFRKLAAAYPKHKDIHKAQYGIGETLFLLERYRDSFEAFKTYLMRFPRAEDAEKARKRGGEALYFAKHFDEAYKIFETLIKSSKTPEVRLASAYYLGKIDYEKNRIEAAAANFQKVIAVGGDNPFAPYATYYLGEALLAQNKWVEAAKYFGGLADADDPELVQLAFFGGGKAKFLQEDYPGSAADFKKAYDIAADQALTEDAFINLMSALFNQEDFDGMIALYQKDATRITDPKKQSRAKLLAAQVYARKGEFDKTLALHEELVSSADLSPEDKEDAWISMAQSLMDQGETAFAFRVLNSLKPGTTIRPERVLYLKAQVLKQSGRNEEALGILARLIKDFPESGLLDQVVIERAYLFLELDRFKEAHETMKDFLERFGNTDVAPKVYADLIVVSVRMEEFERAITESENFLLLYPDAPEVEKVHYRLASLYSEVGDYDKAHKIYETHLKRFKDIADPFPIWMAMGFNRQRAGDFTGALAYYERVEEGKIDPDLYVEVLKNAAHSAVNLELYPEAAGMYQNIIDHYPNHKLGPEIYFWMADRYSQAQDGQKLALLMDKFRMQHDPDAYGSQLAYYLGESRRLLAEHGQAVVYYDECIARDLFAVPNAYLGKALSLTELSDFVRADQAFQEALKRTRDDHELAVRVRSRMGDAYFKRQNFREAAKAYFAIAILYDNEEVVPPALFKAGESFEKSGNADHAVQAYRELTDRFAKHPLAREAEKRLEALAR